MVVTFITGNLKDFLMKELTLLKHDYGITQYLNHYNITKLRIKFDGGCLKENQATIHGAIVNISIVYEITDNFNISSYLKLENCLFAAVSLN